MSTGQQSQENCINKHLNWHPWMLQKATFLSGLLVLTGLVLFTPDTASAGVAVATVDISVDTYGVTPFDVDIEYNEAVYGLTQSDFYVTNASISSFTGSGTSYTLTLQPNLTGTIDIYVGPYASQSISTGDYSRGIQRHVYRNQTRPTAQFTAVPLTGCSIPHTVFFVDHSLDTGSAVLGGPDIWQYNFGDGNNSTLQNPVHSYTAYGTYSVELTTTQVYSGHQDSATETIFVDNTFATSLGVTVSAAQIGPAGGTATFRFSEPVETLSASDFSISSATIDSIAQSGDAATWAVDFTPTAGATQMTLGLSGTNVRDLDSGCPSSVSPVSFTRSVDLVAPTIAIAANVTALNSGQSTSVSFTLSEVSTDFDANDIVVTGGTLTGFSGSGRSYQATFTPDANSNADGTISVGSGTFTDALGNPNTDGAEVNNNVTLAIDTQHPNLAINADRNQLAAGQQTEVRFILSEASTDFGLDDIAFSGGNLSNFSGSGNLYTAIFTPDPDSIQPAALSVASGRFSDAAGNFNTDGGDSNNSIALTVDTQFPTVVLTNSANAFSDRASLQVSITFSETVTGFEAGDVDVTNGGVTAFSGVGRDYLITVTASGSGDARISVPANVAVDSSGNGNLASAELNVSNQTIAETQDVIANLVIARATQVLSHQPKLSCHLHGGCGPGQFAAEATRDAMSFNAQSKPEQPLWMRLSGSRVTEDTSESDYFFAAIGTHAAVSNNALFGLMLQFDHIRQHDGSSEANGRGWLAGPYIVGRLPHHPLFIEGQVLVGQAQNSITPFGTYEDRFDSRRLLAKLKVSGELRNRETTFSPKFAVSYVSETQRAYVDSLSNTIPSQKLEMRQFEVGMGLSRPFETAHSTWIIGADLAALHSETSGNGAFAALTTGQDGPRGRLDLSASTQLANGAQLDISAFYDGLGLADFESYGVSFGYQIQF